MILQWKTALVPKTKLTDVEAMSVFETFFRCNWLELVMLLFLSPFVEGWWDLFLLLSSASFFESGIALCTVNRGEKRINVNWLYTMKLQVIFHDTTRNLSIRERTKTYRCWGIVRVWHIFLLWTGRVPILISLRRELLSYLMALILGSILSPSAKKIEATLLNVYNITHCSEP